MIRRNLNGIVVSSLSVLHVAMELARNVAAVFGDRAGIMCLVPCYYSSIDLVKI